MLRSTYLALAMGIVIIFSACGGGGGSGNDADDIVHNGVTYKAVASPFTQHIWLDRNLGASRVCVDLNDSECYGDYYQWGRDTDGHEKGDSNTSTTLLATSSTPSSDFIISASGWTLDSNATKIVQNWKKVDGTSVCPVGYRVPTREELANETKEAVTAVTNTSEAFVNFLKIPATGSRNTSATLTSEGTRANIWTTDFHGEHSVTYTISETGMSHHGDRRAYGYSVRCMKHFFDTSAPVITSSSDVNVTENQFFVTNIIASDYSRVTYTISDANSSYFNIDVDDGEVNFNNKPNYDTDPHSYTFKVTVTDILGHATSQDITVNLLELVEDTEPPVFTSEAIVSVYENNTTALTVVATDESLPLLYSIGGDDGQYFDINSSSGVITFKIAPNFEKKQTYEIRASAKDSATRRRTAYQYITITILDDVNEVPDTTAPIFTSVATLSIPENQLIVLTLMADDNETVTYSIDINDSASFNVDPQTGKITFQVAPDFENAYNTYTFVAKATDAFFNETTQNITINILDIIDDAISHNSLDYLKVISPITGTTWLDRNIGATTSCTASDESDCYGDYYQWAREADGHEKTTSGTTNTQATSISGLGSDFILSDDNHSLDWAKDIDENGTLRLPNWAKTDGSSLCPDGFRVPTVDELKNEIVFVADEYRIASNEDALAHFLRLSMSGYRSPSTGDMEKIGQEGMLWTNSIRAGYSQYTQRVGYTSSSGGGLGPRERAKGMPVRCVED